MCAVEVSNEDEGGERGMGGGSTKRIFCKNTPWQYVPLLPGKGVMDESRNLGSTSWFISKGV